MFKNLIEKWTEGFRALRDDERGAESSEVILVLVLLVIGLMAAFAFLRDKLGSQSSRVGNCIGGADTKTSC